MATWSTTTLAEATEADRLDAEYFDTRIRELIGEVRALGGTPLGDVCGSIINGTTPTAYSDDGDSLVVRAGDLVAPLIYPTCGPPFLRAHRVSRSVALKKRDVLISSIGMGSIGKVSLVMDPTRMITVSEVTVLRNPSARPEFVFFYLRTSWGQRQINREVTGATGQQHLLKDKVARILLPPPPKGLPEKLAALCDEIWAQERALASQYAVGAEMARHGYRLPD